MTGDAGRLISDFVSGAVSGNDCGAAVNAGFSAEKRREMVVDVWAGGDSKATELDAGDAVIWVVFSSRALAGLGVAVVVTVDCVAVAGSA